MNTDRPTSELYFSLAYTHCKLTVYSKDADLMREVLMEHHVEFFEHKDEKCQEIDTRVLFDLTREALPKILERRLQKGLPVLLGIR